MVTKKVNNKTFEYNEDKYEIEYSKNQGVIILKKRCNNEILKVFDDNTMFILEYDNDKDDNASFIVGEHSNNCLSEGKLYHYIEDNNELSTFLISKLDNADIEKCRVSKNTFITKEGNSSDNKYVFYNVKKGVCQHFKKILANDEVHELFGENKVFIKEVRNPDREKKDAFTDTLTYLIDTETFEICSLIWSDLEQRFIRVYTKEEAEYLKNEYDKKGKSINLSESLDEITKQLEVDQYIKILNDKLETPDVIKEGKLNKDFVYRFKKD